MEQQQIAWRSAEPSRNEGPSLDFIRAIADLLETNPEDILTELGYKPSAEVLAIASR